jgi:hypothetical protein
MIQINRRKLGFLTQPSTEQIKRHLATTKKDKIPEDFHSINLQFIVRNRVNVSIPEKK